MHELNLGVMLMCHQFNKGDTPTPQHPCRSIQTCLNMSAELLTNSLPMEETEIEVMHERPHATQAVKAEAIGIGGVDDLETEVELANSRESRLGPKRKRVGLLRSRLWRLSGLEEEVVAEDAM
mmetsp:Transcript_34614/g.82685  ORF Transcript_34614/g.82685 Transcript_34614/m.82685 type:complete len:123 (+) Transcript_34614:1289-1657(+)